MLLHRSSQYPDYKSKRKTKHLMATFASSSTGKTVPTSPLLSSDVINEKSLVQTLLTAVDENNVFCNFDFVSVTAGETGEDRSRSLRLKQDVNQDELVIKIPTYSSITANAFDTLLLNHSNNNEKNNETRIYETENELKKQFLLLLHISFSNVASSLYKAYLATLPSIGSFKQYLPLYWSKSKIDSFGPLFTPMLQSYIDRLNKEEDAMRMFLIEEIAKLHNLYPGLFPATCLESLTKNDNWLYWAFGITNSRTVDLVIRTKNENKAKEEINNPGLDPVFDLLNHAEAESATVYITVEKDDENPTNKYVCARASRKLLAGEELRFKYHQEGELLHYLFYYGFIPQDRDPMET